MLPKLHFWKHLLYSNSWLNKLSYAETIVFLPDNFDYSNEP